MKKLIFYSFLIVLFVSPVKTQTVDSLREASGIAVKGSTFFIVSDDSNNVYYELVLSKNELKSIDNNLNTNGAVIVFVNINRFIKRNIGNAYLAYDLEAVEILAKGDGRKIFLSERNHCILDTTGKPVAEYHDKFTEFGNRGLEGLAVKEEAGLSKVAVLWEGGYLDKTNILDQILKNQKNSGKYFLEPVLIIHEIDSGKIVGEVPSGKKDSLLLHVPRFSEGDGFRAPDLVYDGDSVWVLLSSENLKFPYTSPDRFKYKRLQKFNIYNGKPSSKYIDLNQKIKSAGKYIISKKSLKTVITKDMLIKWANWEGMDWYKEGESVVLVYDTYPKGKKMFILFFVKVN